MPSASPPIAAPTDVDEDPRVFTSAIGGRWVQNDGVHICLAQTLHATVEAVKTGASRPGAVRTLCTLLDSSAPATRDHGITGGPVPGIIVAPELALGPSDWADIDEAVRGCDSQRMVIAGCGHVKGEWINEWLSDTSGETSRLRGWPTDAHEVLPARPYNVGFAWIRTDTHCQCVLFLKNFIDQGLEHGLVPNLASGTYLLRLQADDLVVFPLICSEFHRALETEGHPGSAARRIKRSLDASSAGTRRLLITGSAHTNDPGHSLWERAFTHMFEHVHPAPLIAFVNGAEVTRGHDGFLCNVDPTVDLWRNRTGVYKPLPATGEKTRARSTSTIPVHNASVDAVVARESFALVVGGEARWVRSMTGGSYLWLVQARAVLDGTGAVADIDVGTAFSYEILHASARRREVQRPKPEWAGSPQPDVVAKYRTHSFRHECSSVFTVALCNDVHTHGTTSLDRLGYGVLIGCDLDQQRVAKHTTALSDGFLTTPFDLSLTTSLDASLDAAGVVWTTGAATMVDCPGLSNRTAFLAFESCFLIWASPWLAYGQMRREIDNWRRADADGTRVVVLGRSAAGDFESLVPAPPLFRGDVTMPDGEAGVHVPRENRVVSLFPIARLIEACQAAPGEEISTLKSRLKAMLMQTVPSVGSAS